jgi:hypothetical protein
LFGKIPWFFFWVVFVFISTACYHTTAHLSSLLEGAPWLHYRTLIALHQLAQGEAGKKKVADLIADNRGIIPLVAI